MKIELREELKNTTQKASRLELPVMQPFYSKDGITIYNADYNSVLPLLRSTNALITDLPYGLRKELRRKWHGNNGNTKLHSDNEWDIKIDNISDLLIAEQIILWGGNFYKLPPTDTWLVWDKLQDNRGSDAELAWARLNKRGCRVFRMSRIDAYFNKRIFNKEHPHEKPIQLMEFCVAKTTGTIIDLFVGSGSTLIAAKRLGREAIGVDINKHWCEVSAKRLDETKYKSEVA